LQELTDFSEMSQWEVDKLITHVMAMALFVDDWNTDMTDLKDDFRLETPKTISYFRELGCRIGAPNDREKLALKLTVAETKARKVARLQFPLNFVQENEIRRPRSFAR
jgi:DNA-directed RNA polymerase I subunit RPA49